MTAPFARPMAPKKEPSYGDLSACHVRRRRVREQRPRLARENERPGRARDAGEVAVEIGGPMRRAARCGRHRALEVAP
jgi:hypothetical protein